MPLPVRSTITQKEAILLVLYVVERILPNRHPDGGLSPKSTRALLEAHTLLLAVTTPRGQDEALVAFLATWESGHTEEMEAIRRGIREARSQAVRR